MGEGTKNYKVFNKRACLELGRRSWSRHKILWPGTGDLNPDKWHGVNSRGLEGRRIYSLLSYLVENLENTKLGRNGFQIPCLHLLIVETLLFFFNSSLNWGRKDEKRKMRTFDLQNTVLSKVKRKDRKW